jgi:hypothetical protein
METSENTTKSKNFFKHVFNFNEEIKTDVLNVIQYALLAIIPIVVLNKSMQKFVPEADEEKGSLEILLEVVLQIVTMFVGLVFIDRIITYFPTYSGIKYKDFSVLYIVLAVLLITLSLQTKLGEKVGILVNRLSELWEGTTDEDKKKKKKEKMSNIKVTQPISQNNSLMSPLSPIPSSISQNAYNQSMMSQAMYTDGTSIHSLPSDGGSGTGSTKQQNFDAMYRKDTNPLQNASSPGEGSMNEPMPANAALGNSAFSNW